jgi:prophage regulatory protein
MSATENLRPERMRRARRILRLPEVERRTGLHKSKLYDAVVQGVFPKPLALGKRASGWVEDEIDAWIEQRIAERDAGTAVRSLPLTDPKAEEGRQRALARRRRAAARRAARSKPR